MLQLYTIQTKNIAIEFSFFQSRLVILLHVKFTFCVHI